MVQISHWLKMGNFPLCVSSQVQEGVVFGEYDRFTLKPPRPLSESIQDLSVGDGGEYMKRWGDGMSMEGVMEEGTDEDDVILGLELQQDSVSRRRRMGGLVKGEMECKGMEVGINRVLHSHCNLSSLCGSKCMCTSVLPL